MTGYTFNQLFDFTRTTSATFVGSNGLIQTTPASANLLTYTQEFDNAAWTKSNATVTANVTTAPDGTLTADKLIDNATNGGHNTSQSCSLISGVSYTLSAYVKKDDLSFCAIGVYDAATKYQTFDLNTGAKGSNSGITGSTIDPVGNGWYRVSITFVAAITGTCFPTIYLINSTTFAGYVGSGTGVFFWGAQLEVGSTATTYARNNGGVYPARFDYDPVTLAPKGILIEEQRTNLFTYSEDLSNAVWTKTQLTVSTTAGISPSGANTANSLTPTAANAQHFIQNGLGSLTGGQSYTMSFRVKANGYRWLRIGLDAVAVVSVDVQTGTIGQTSGTSTRSVRNIGNGWFEIAIAWVSGGTSQTIAVSINNADSLGTLSFSGDGTSNVLFWGFQVEAGAFATSYIPTVASQVTRSADTCAITAPMFAPWYKQTEGTFVAQFSGTGSYAAVANDGTVNNYNGITYNSTTTVRGVTVAAGVFAGITMTGGAVGSVNKTAYGYKLNDLAGSTNGGAIVANATAAIPTVTQLLVGTYGGFGQLNGHIRSIKYYPFRASNNQLQVLST